MKKYNSIGKELAFERHRDDQIEITHFITHFHLFETHNYFRNLFRVF